MKSELVKLTKDLINFPTEGDNLDALIACAGFIQDYFSGLDIKIKEHIANDKPALLITFPKRAVNVFFNGHIDVVAGSKEQFTPIVKGDKLYGRGAVDMKGSIAVFMKLMKDFSVMETRPKVGLMIVSDEETGLSSGTRRLLDRGQVSEFGICGEPTNLKIGNKTKGMLAYQIHVTGVASHGSRPWEGKNAILEAIYRYTQLEKEFQNTAEGDCSIALTRIHGGDAMNRVPDHCDMTLDIRYTHESDADRLRPLVRKTFKDCVDTKIFLPPLNVEPETDYIQKLKQSSQDILGSPASLIRQYGTSDAVAFAERAIPAIEFGPSGAGWHGSDEYVNISSLKQYYDILKKFSLAL